MPLRSFVSCTSLSNAPSLIKWEVIKLLSPIPEFLQVSTAGQWQHGVIPGRIRLEGALTQIIRLSAPTFSKSISKAGAELQRKQKGFLQTPPGGKSGRNTQQRGNGGLTVVFKTEQHIIIIGGDFIDNTDVWASSIDSTLIGLGWGTRQCKML